MARRISPRILADVAQAMEADILSGRITQIGCDRMIDDIMQPVDALGILLARAGVVGERLLHLERRKLSPYEVIEEVIRKPVSDCVYDASLLLQNACDSQRRKGRMGDIASALNQLAFGLARMAAKKGAA